MSNPIHPDDISSQFANLTDVMKKMSEQTFTQNSGDKKIYEESSKVYVKLGENDRLVTDIGTSAKRAKGLTADELADTIEKIITVAAKSGALSKKFDKIDGMVLGLETLKDRIKASKQSMSPLKRFFLEAFGYMDKYNVAIEKINQAIETVKITTLPLQISQLRMEEYDSKQEIVNLRSNLYTLTQASEKKAEERKKIEVEIKTCKQELTQLERESEKLIREKSSLNTQLKPLEKAQAQLNEAEKELKKVKEEQSPKGVFKKIFNATPLAVQTATSKRDEAKKGLKELEKSLSKSLEQLDQVNNQIEENKKRKDEVEKQLTKAKVRFQPIENNQANIKETEQQIKSKEKELEEKQKVISAKEKELKELQQGTPEVTLKVSKKPAQPNFPFPPQGSRGLLEDFMAKLAPTADGNASRYIRYQRALIFGFSMGQKKSIESLDKQVNLDIDDLKKMLEGGNHTLNMLYVSNYLDMLIPKAKSEQKDPNYIQALEKLQADLKRSTPLAFMISSIGNSANPRTPSVTESSFKQISREMSAELKKMKPGERLMIPTGTTEHATLLVLEKTKDGKISPTFYNTGEGVEHHITTGLNVKTLVDNLNVLADKFPTTKTYPSINLDTDQKTFESMMVEILKVQTDADKSVGDIHTELQRNLGEGKSGRPKKVQINGVCSFQVLSEAFKDILGSKVAYNHYKQDLLEHIQEEFQEITDAMKPSIGQDEEMRKLYELHQAMLEDNAAQIEETKKILAKAKKK